MRQAEDLSHGPVKLDRRFGTGPLHTGVSFFAGALPALPVVAFEEPRRGLPFGGVNLAAHRPFHKGH